jgi:hypothetical protein
MTAAVTTSVPISIPCDEVTVRVRVGLGDQLAEVEKAVLRVITVSEWHRSIDNLVEVLGLGPRMLADVLRDLWRGGHVMIDMHKGLVRPSPDVERRVRAERGLGDRAAGTLDELPTGQIITEEYPILLDKLTGHAFAGASRPGPLSSRAAVPVDSSGIRIEDTTIAQRLDAVQQALRLRRRSGGDGEPPEFAAAGRERRVMGVALAPRELRRPEGRRWLAADVKVTRTAGGRFVVELFCEQLPEANRLHGAQRLTDLVNEWPNEPFVRMLVEAEADDLAPAATLEGTMAELDERIRDLAAAPRNSAAEADRLVRRDAGRAVELLERRMRDEVGATLVRGAAQHTVELRGIIEAARHQLVIVSPTLTYPAVSGVANALRDAMDRGVQVVVLWGRLARDDVAPEVANLMHSLRRYGAAEAAASTQMLWTRQSSRVNVGLAVADDTVALVTPRHLLGRGSQSVPDQYGVRIEGPDPALGSPVHELLRWARNMFADPRMVAAIRYRAGEFPAAAEPPAEFVKRREVPGYLRTHLPDPVTDDGSGVTDAGTRLQSTAQVWADWARELRRAVADGPPWMSLVMNAGHRDVLWDALRRARRRLVVHSTRIGPAVVDAAFGAELEARLGANAQVTILYQAVDGNAAPAVQLLEERAEAHPATMVSRRHDGGGLLVVDDELLITGFDLLGDDGGAPAVQRELGVRIRGGRLADQVRYDDAEDAPAIDRPAVAPPTRAELETSLVVNRILHLSGSAGQTALAPVRTAPDPWSLLDRVSADGAGPELLRRAVAAALGRRPLPLPAEAARWRRWLIEDRWRDQAFQEAAILGHGLPDDSADRPGPLLVRCAALRGYAAGQESLETAALQAALAAPGDPIVVAYAVLLATEMLLGLDRNEPEPAADPGVHVDLLAENLESLVLPELTPPWDEFAAAAVAYARATHVPLPMARIAEDVGRGAEPEPAADGWQHLTALVSRARQTTFPFQSGIKTHANLFHDSGHFGRLAAIAERRQIEELHRWLPTVPAKQLGDYLDRMTALAAPGQDTIDGSRRRYYLEKLEAAVRAAHKLARAGSAETGGFANAAVIEARDFAGRLYRSWSALRAALNDVPEPESLLVAVALEDLRTVVHWGKP